MREGTGALKCPKCGVTTGSNDYCPECGEPLTIECPKCGTTWRFWENIKYCPNCGSKAEKRGVEKKVKSIKSTSAVSMIR